MILILDGIGTSVAATRMAFQPAMPAAVSMALRHATPNSTKHHCADGQQTGSAADAGHEAELPAGTGKHPAPDCCQATCDCACLQATPASFVMVFMPRPVIARAANTRIVNLAYPTPALPHLIRPPIG